MSIQIEFDQSLSYKPTVSFDTFGFGFGFTANSSPPNSLSGSSSPPTSVAGGGASAAAGASASSITVGVNGNSNSTATTTTDDGSAPTALNDYTVVRHIAEGAFGSCDLAFRADEQDQDEQKRTLVVIKTAKKGRTADDDTTAELKHEVDFLLQMPAMRQPGFVQLLGFERIPGGARAVLEHCEGGSITSQLARLCCDGGGGSGGGGGGLPEASCRRIIFQILCALEPLHELGTVHRDLKSCNILLSKIDERANSTDSSSVNNNNENNSNNGDPLSNFFAKIADLGSSSSLVQDDSTIGMTVRYMPPQAILKLDGFGAQPDDIWAVGCILCNMLSAEKVWSTEVAPTLPQPRAFHELRKMFQAAIDAAVASSGSTVSLTFLPANIASLNLSPECLDFLSRCLSFDPARRGTATSLLAHAWLAPELARRDDNLHHLIERQRSLIRYLASVVMKSPKTSRLWLLLARLLQQRVFKQQQQSHEEDEQEEGENVEFIDMGGIEVSKCACFVKFPRSNENEEQNYNEGENDDEDDEKQRIFGRARCFYRACQLQPSNAFWSHCAARELVEQKANLMTDRQQQQSENDAENQNANNNLDSVPVDALELWARAFEQECDAATYVLNVGLMLQEREEDAAANQNQNESARTAMAASGRAKRSKRGEAPAVRRIVEESSSSDEWSSDDGEEGNNGGVTAPAQQKQTTSARRAPRRVVESSCDSGDWTDGTVSDGASTPRAQPEQQQQQQTTQETTSARRGAPRRVVEDSCSSGGWTDGTRGDSDSTPRAQQHPQRQQRQRRHEELRAVARIDRQGRSGRFAISTPPSEERVGRFRAWLPRKQQKRRGGEAEEDNRRQRQRQLVRRTSMRAMPPAEEEAHGEPPGLGMVMATSACYAFDDGDRRGAQAELDMMQENSLCGDFGNEFAETPREEDQNLATTTTATAAAAKPKLFLSSTSDSAHPVELSADGKTASITLTLVGARDPRRVPLASSATRTLTALDCFRLAAELDPADCSLAKTSEALRVLQRADGSSDEDAVAAERLLVEAVEADRRNTRAWRELGKCLRKRGAASVSVGGRDVSVQDCETRV